MPINIKKIDGRVFPNGRKMFKGLDLTNLEEIPLLPEGGLLGQVLTKDSDLDYDLIWTYVVSDALNGLYIDNNSTVKLGGMLIENTTVTGASNFPLSFTGITDLLLQAVNNFILATPLVSTKNTGAILQLQNNTGLVEYTPFNLPTSIGTNGQTLITDASGNVTWGTAASNVTGADNGLTLVGTIIELGGTLIKNTLIDCDAFNFTMSNSSLIQLISNNFMSIQGDTTIIRGESLLNLVTSNIITPPIGVGNGSILQLINSVVGTVEYSPFKFPLVDGASNQILQTDGNGQVSWINIPSGGITSANNGLNLSGSTVRLGGELLFNTNVFSNSFAMSFDAVKEFNVRGNDHISLQVTSDSQSENRTVPLVAYKYGGGRIGAIAQEEVITLEVARFDVGLTGTMYAVFPIPPNMTQMFWKDITVSTFTTTLPTAGKVIPIRVESNTGTLTWLSGTNHPLGNATYSPVTAPQLSGFGGKLRVRITAATGGNPAETAFGLTVTLRISSIS